MLYPPRIFFMMAHANLPPKEEAWSLLETFFEHAVRPATSALKLPHCIALGLRVSELGVKSRIC